MSNIYYDYTNQAWVENGRYVRCGHPESMACKCHGRIHAGESATVPPPEPVKSLAHLPADQLFRAVCREDRLGFITDDELEVLRVSKYRDVSCLVRTGRDRYKLRLDAVPGLIRAVESDGDYVRDVAVLFRFGR